MAELVKIPIGAKSATGSYGTVLTITADTAWPMLSAIAV